MTANPTQSAATTLITGAADGDSLTIPVASGPGPYPARSGSVTPIPTLSGTRLLLAGVNGAPDAALKSSRATPAVPGLSSSEAGPMPHRPTSLSQPFGFTAGACGYGGAR